MRIGFVADDLYPGYGGQARASHGHIAALVALGHEVRVVAGVEAHPTEPPPRVEIERLPVWRLGRIQTQFALPRRRAIRALVEWADVVHVNAPTPLGATVCRMGRARGVPVVMGVHVQIETSRLHLPAMGRLVGWALAGWYRWLYRQPTCLTAPTPFAAEMARGFTDHPVHPVSNGVDLEFDPPTLPKRQRPGAERSVVYVGRLSPEKRPEDLLEIARHLSIRTRLTVVGDGPMRRQLARTCMLLGIEDRVAFVGFVDEPTKAALLDDAEVFLMPSPTELQSIATLEAMAHGCAVVAAGFPTSAVPSLVRESGAGRIYAPGRFVEVADTIDGLLDDREQLLAYQRNALRAVRRHDVKESGRILAALYAGLTQQTTRRGSRSWTPRKV